MMEQPHPGPGPAAAAAAAMATARNLVYHLCVAKGTIVLADYSSPSPDDDEAADVVRAMAGECLQHVPPYHSRFSHCSAGRRYALLIEPDVVLVAVADEALPKATVYALLEHARDDFRRVFKSRGLSLGASDDILLAHAPALRRDTAPALRRLVAPLVGVPHNSVATEPTPQQQQQQPPIVHDSSASPPQPPTTASSATEETSADKRSFCPLLPKAGKHEKKKVRDQAAASAEDSEAAVKVRSVAHKGIDVMVDNNNNNSSSINSDGAGPGPCAMGMGISVQRCASGGVGGRSKGQQMAQRMWWRNVRVVLLLDVAVCAILFAIWLGICNGFNCISNN